MENSLEMTWCGYLVLRDPPRPTVRASIEKVKLAGVRVVMITGDCLETAKAIGDEIAIKENNGCFVTDCRSVKELFDRYITFKDKEKKKLDEKESAELLQVQKEIDEIVTKTDVFARARPQDKLVIVQSKIRCGEIVAMTGDGVNDAPAVKQAHVGIAMGNGADLLKNVASMILLNNDFTSIVCAIEEGRRIYANVTKFVYFLLSTNPAEVLLFLISAGLDLRAPMTPIMILWVNLITDSLPALALGFELIESDLMFNPPVPPTEPLVTFNMWGRVIVHSIFQTGYYIGMYILALYNFSGSWDGKPVGASEDFLKTSTKQAQTMMLMIVVFSELGRAYSCKSYDSVCTKYFDNRMLNLSVFGGIVLTIIVVFVPGLKDVFGFGELNNMSSVYIVISFFVLFLFDIFVKLLFVCCKTKNPTAIKSSEKKNGSEEVVV